MQQALDISSNTKLFTSYFQNNIIVQKYFHMDGNSIFIAFQWSARGKGKIFEKNNVYMYVCVLLLPWKSIPVHLYRVTFTMQFKTWCFLANYTRPLPSALMRHQLPGQFVFSCFSLTIWRTSHRLRVIIKVICFSSNFFFSWNMKMEIDLLQRIFLKIQILRFEEMWNFNGSGKEIRDSGILFFKKFNLLYFELAYLKNIYSQYNY